MLSPAFVILNTRSCYVLGDGNMEILLMMIIGIIGFALDGATERKN